MHRCTSRKWLLRWTRWESTCLDFRCRDFLGLESTNCIRCRSDISDVPCLLVLKQARSLPTLPVFGLHRPVAVFDWLPLQVLSVLPLPCVVGLLKKLCSGSAARPVVTLVAELVPVALGRGVAELVLVALAAAEELAELVLVPLVWGLAAAVSLVAELAPVAAATELVLAALPLPVVAELLPLIALVAELLAGPKPWEWP